MLFRSSDGQLLIVSSSDGFCSIISFSKDELGSPYIDNTKDEMMNVEEESMVQENIEEISIDKSTPNGSPSKVKQVTNFSEPSTKKRVQLVTLSSPKTKTYLKK